MRRICESDIIDRMIRSTAGTSSTNIAAWKRCCAVLVMVMAGGSWLASCSSSKPPSTPTVKVPSAAVTDAEVAAAYENFFNLHNPSLSAKLDAIQDGKALQKAVSTAMSSSLAKAAAGAKVSSVTPYTKTQCADSGLVYPCAKAAYTILSPGGQPLTTGAGYAVFTGGKWLVAKSTVCGLLGSFSEYSNSKAPIPGCPS